MFNIEKRKEMALEIAELDEKVTYALDKMDHTINLFDRGNSLHQNSLMVVGAEYTPTRRLRQVAAELQRKQQALVEAKNNVLKRKARSELYREKAENEESPAKKALLLLEADTVEESIYMVERPYKGALKAVLELQKLHDKIEAEIIEKHGEITEEIIDQEESRYWIIRIFTQSLQDIRQSGCILSGNQIVLKNLGLDPNFINKLLKEWLMWRNKIDDISIKYEEEFLEECADKYCHIIKGRIKENLGEI